MPKVVSRSFSARTKSKYNAEASRDSEGNYFASKKEKMFFKALQEREKAGEVKNLEFQPRYEIVINGKKIGYFRADFRFTDLREDPPRQRIIDVKGVDTRDGKLRRRIVEALYDITVELA
jgi:hypothetical protein